ncbi:unnamed protein product, partial [Polarella glacialis]
ASDGPGDVAQVTRAIKGARVIRVLRLVRLFKLQRLFNMVYDLIDSEYMFIVFTMAKLVLFIFVINHIIACVWYMVGRMTMEQGEFSWIKDTGRAPVFEQGLAWRYTTALHWSLTQFTPASMDVNARNVPERVMSILVLFFSLITFSSIV